MQTCTGGTVSSPNPRMAQFRAVNSEERTLWFLPSPDLLVINNLGVHGFAGQVVGRHLRADRREAISGAPFSGNWTKLFRSLSCMELPKLRTKYQNTLKKMEQISRRNEGIEHRQIRVSGGCSLNFAMRILSPSPLSFS